MLTQNQIVLELLRSLRLPTSGDIEDESMRQYHKRIRGVTQRISELRKHGAIIECVKDGKLNRLHLVKEPEPSQLGLRLKVA